MNAADEIDVDALILVVVGAHLRAEMDDRPHAQRLCERISAQLRDLAQDDDQLAPLQPTICTDVWYLNNQELLERPAISIGEPGVNAATAYLSNRLPTAMVVDHTLRIQLDPEFIEPQACLWGSNPQNTGTAVDMFVERYLREFLLDATNG